MNAPMTARAMGGLGPFESHWHGVVRHSPLALLLDLDGTLIPLSSTPDDADVDPELRELLSRCVALPNVVVAVVSGRPQPWTSNRFDDLPGLWVAAEHGAWRRGAGAWEHALELDPAPLEALAAELESIVGRYPGAVLERKTWSLSIHSRAVRSAGRVAFIVEARAAVMDFLGRTPGFERVDAAEVIEVRASAMSKSLTVPWLRERAGDDARIVALGDDVTDEHMFASLGPRDESVLVRERAPKRRTSARWRLRDSDDVRAFLRWIVALREGDETSAPVVPLELEPPQTPRGAAEETRGLLVVSNRLPDLRTPELPGESGIYDGRKRNVGGLVSALQPALEQRGGLWLGWSGRSVAENEEPTTGIEESTNPPMAWLDFTERWVRDHYGGFCNRTLWPLFHSFPERTQFSEQQWRAFVEVNAAFADACDSLGRHGTIWAHDYHLLLLARELRRRGHTVPIGLFLHIPFPSLDILSILPWADELLDAMCDFDLVAFHTPDFAANFIRCATALLGASAGDEAIQHRGRRVAVRAIPIGILPEGWEDASDDESSEELAALQKALAGRKLVLGVDRLDYTKGIPERLLAFGRLLELYPEWRDQVSLVQVSVPSRADVPDYVEQRSRIESIVGRINGEFGEAHWVPIRYLYRSYNPRQLAQLYRFADVGYVTPLRDGMNLVAKEYVAAQDPASPGALLLSRFAGAAHEMRDAVLTNPWHVDGMAKDLDRALRMPLDERQQRHARLRAVVDRTTATSWAETFLDELARTR